MSLKEEDSNAAEGCFSLGVAWNQTLVEDTLTSFGVATPTASRLEDLGSSAKGINYSLTFSDCSRRQRWRVRLAPTALSYRLPTQRLAGLGGQLLAQLSLEALSPNGSHLHLVSRSLLNLSSLSNCSGEPHTTHSFIRNKSGKRPSLP